MQAQSYYRLEGDSSCNFRVEDRLLTVNCCGACVLMDPFITYTPVGRHDFYLMILKRGALTVLTESGMQPLAPGQMIIIPPDHPYRYEKSGKGEMIYYWIHFSGSGAQALLAQCGFSMRQIHTVSPGEEIDATMAQIFRQFILRESSFEIEAASLLFSLMGRLLRLREERTPPAFSMKDIQESLGYLYRNYASAITVAQLAEMEHLSASRYMAVFKKCTGVSPIHFLVSLRMTNAAGLMLKTDLSVKQVAQAVGYADQMYFSRLFKKQYGLPPAAYRAKNTSQISARG